jgi:two-component system, OmpR family, alkaline phosphatase synthesis response regulator PhoP
MSMDIAPRLVLIADDDVDILTLVRVRLERSGYTVISARNGVEALQLARDRHPDLAILDVAMPEMTGLEVTQHMREEKLDVPVILLTARARDVDVAAGADAGADVYVTKPFSPQELESRVRAISHG